MSLLWVSLAGERRLAAFDAFTGKECFSVTGFVRPGALCIFGRFVYALDEAEGTVTCVDALEARRVWTQPAAPGPTAILATPEGRLYVAGGDSNTIVAIDSGDGRLLEVARVGGYPRSLDLCLDGGSLLVSCAITSCIQLLSARTLETQAERELPHPACGAVFSVDGGVAALVKEDGRAGHDGWLCRMDASLHILDGARFPGTPLCLTRRPDGELMLLSHTGGLTALRPDCTPIWTLPLDGMVDRVVFSADGSTAYVLNTVLDSVHVVNMSGQSVVCTWPVGLEPSGIALTK